MKAEKIKDNFEKAYKSLDNILSKEILVGIPESASAREKGEITNSQIGYINEFGSPLHNIPARPHLIPGILAIRDKAAKLMAQAIKITLEGKNGIDKLNQVGAIAQSSIRNIITLGEGYAPPAQATLDARRRAGRSSDKPLIDTSEYLKSITYVIDDINS